jgi:DNA-binding MarR family transcriptional regulator
MGHQPATDQAATITIPADARPYIRWTRNENMTCRQAAVLAIVEANPGVTVGAVARVLDIPKPSVTRAADKLEMWGQLIRSRHPMDKRLVELHAKKPAPARTGQSTRRGG